MILSFRSNAEGLFPYTPSWHSNEFGFTADYIYNRFMNDQNINSEDIKQKFIIWWGENDYYYMYDVFMTTGRMVVTDRGGGNLQLFNQSGTMYSYRVRIDKSNQTFTYASPEQRFEVTDSIDLTDLDIYFDDNSETIAIVHNIRVPGGHSTGNVVVPEFPEPDQDDKTQIINIIGWKGLFENFEKFFKPYLDHTFDVLDTIIGFPDNDFILDQYHNSYLYSNLVAPVNLITQSVVGLFNAPDVQGHGTPRFELDFSNVVGFESVGKVYLDFNWYVPFKTQINSVIIALVVLGFIVYLIKEIPNLIAGRSDKND